METQSLIEKPDSTEVSPPAPSSSVAKPSVSLLEKLPPELRNIIYSICIVTKVTVIRSPLPKIRRKDRPFSTFWSLLMVNKTIYKEASSWYYTSTSFVFGYGSWASTVEPNLHAMKEFVKRVKKEQLTLITKVYLEIQAIPRYRPGGSADQRAYILGDKVAASDLRTISRTFLKNFTGLEEIKIQLAITPQWVQLPPHPVWLTEEQTVEVLRKFLLELLKLENITAIRVFRNKEIPMQGAAKRILESKPEIAKILSVQDHSIIIHERR